MTVYSKYRTDCIRFLQKLVQTKSVNGRDNESGVIRVITEEAEKPKLPFKVIEKDPKRPNIFVGANFNNAENLLLVAHTDTVPEGGVGSWEYPPFSATIHNDKLFGRGAVDCKGGITLSIYILKILSDLDKLNFSKVCGSC